MPTSMMSDPTACEEPVRIVVRMYVDSLQILAVGVLIKEIIWLDLDAVISTSSFDLFGGMV